MKSLIVGIFLLASFGAQADSCENKALTAVKEQVACLSGTADDFEIAQVFYPSTSQTTVFEVAYSCSGETKGALVAFDDECNGSGQFISLAE